MCNIIEDKMMKATYLRVKNNIGLLCVGFAYLGRLFPYLKVAEMGDSKLKQQNAMMLYQTFWLYPPALAHRGMLSCHPHYESQYSPQCAPGLWSFIALWLLLGLIPSPFSCVLVSLCSLGTSLTPSHLQSTSWWGDGGPFPSMTSTFAQVQTSEGSYAAVRPN